MKTHSVTENGLIINRQGTTDYFGVTKDKNRLNTFWALASIKEDEYEVTGSRTVLYELGVYSTAEEAAETVRDFYKDRDGNVKTLKYFGRAVRPGEGWGYRVPVKDASRSTGPRSYSNKTKKVVAKNEGLTQETVERQVNTLLGQKVTVQTRVLVKDLVVANIEFYRTTSDVTAYVNDLVTYIIK